MACAIPCFALVGDESGRLVERMPLTPARKVYRSRFAALSLVGLVGMAAIGLVELPARIGWTLLLAAAVWLVPLHAGGLGVTVAATDDGLLDVRNPLRRYLIPLGEVDGFHAGGAGEVFVGAAGRRIPVAAFTGWNSRVDRRLLRRQVRRLIAGIDEIPARPRGAVRVSVRPLGVAVTAVGVLGPLAAGVVLAV